MSGQLLVALAFDAATKQKTFFKRDDVLGSVTASNDLRESCTPIESRQVNLARECEFSSKICGEEGSDAKARNHNASILRQKLDNIREWQKDANVIITTMDTSEHCHLSKITENFNAPDWEFFHMVYVGLDSCKLIEQTMDLIEVQNRKIRLIEPANAQEQIKGIRALCEEYRASVHAAVLELIKILSNERQQEELPYSIISRQGDTEDKDPIAYWLRHLFVDERYPQEIVARLQLAWKEALTNVANLTRPS